LSTAPTRWPGKPALRDARVYLELLEPPRVGTPGQPSQPPRSRQRHAAPTCICNPRAGGAPNHLRHVVGVGVEQQHAVIGHAEEPAPLSHSGVLRLCSSYWVRDSQRARRTAACGAPVGGAVALRRRGGAAAHHAMLLIAFTRRSPCGWLCSSRRRPNRLREGGTRGARGNWSPTAASSSSASEKPI
jgi:hypothetical protein